MKVLKNNYKTDEPHEHICDFCGSVLEYNKSDLRIGAYGGAYLKCPCCEYDNLIEGDGCGITLTKDNIQFPTHFNHTIVDDYTVDCCNNETVKGYVNTAIDYLRKNKKEYEWRAETENLCVIVSRYVDDDNYEVFVSNDFYSTYIPFEDEDY